MSIKLMSQVWEMADVSGSELLLLLALADYANDKDICWPSLPTLAKRARISERQTQRVIQQLEADGHIEVLERGNGAGHSSKYRLTLKGDIQRKGDIAMSTLSETKDDTLTPFENNKDDTLSTFDAERVTSGTERVTSSAEKGDIAMSTDPSVNHHIEPTEEKEEMHACDPLVIAWQQAYGQNEIPSHLVTPLQGLIAECGMAATIHGIKASAAKPDGRNFAYIAKCARNYVPPAPLASYANGNPYTIDIPGIVELPAAKQTAPVLPPPMAHDDPWTIALSELSVVLPGSAPRWLQGSSLKENGELAGVPFYRVTLVCPEADPGWLRQQAEPAIRKKLASLLGKRIMLEIVNPHREYAA